MTSTTFRLALLLLIMSMSLGASAYDHLESLCQQSRWEKVAALIEGSSKPEEIPDSALKTCINQSLRDQRLVLFIYFINYKEGAGRHIGLVSAIKAIERRDLVSLRAGVARGMVVTNTRFVESHENVFHILAKIDNDPGELTELFVTIYKAQQPSDTIVSIEDRNIETGQTALGQALSRGSTQIALKLMNMGASLFEAVVAVPHKNVFTYEPLSRQHNYADIVKAWLKTHKLASLRKFFRNPSYPRAHKKAVFDFLHTFAPEAKLQTILTYWREHELKMLNLLLFERKFHKSKKKIRRTLTLWQPSNTCLDMCNQATTDKQYVDFADCHHKICAGCARAIIDFQLKQPVSKFVCPVHNCRSPISWEVLQDEFAVKRSVLLTHMIKANEEKLNCCDQFKHCHEPNCPGGSFVIIPDQEIAGLDLLQCGVCGHVQCQRCGKGHMRIRCDDLQQQSTKEFIDHQKKSGIIKSCPSCGENIEKNEGCDHMTCETCTYEFFWSTLKKYR